MVVLTPFLAHAESASSMIHWSLGSFKVGNLSSLLLQPDHRKLLCCRLGLRLSFQVRAQVAFQHRLHGSTAR